MDEATWLTLQCGTIREWADEAEGENRAAYYNVLALITPHLEELQSMRRRWNGMVDSLKGEE